VPVYGGNLNYPKFFINPIKDLSQYFLFHFSQNPTINTPHPQTPKNLRKIQINPPINLLDVIQIEGNDSAELIMSSSSSEVNERLLGSGSGVI
jgi:hypothetical protein|tara:strand:- start:51 stop:329 length:279 start_codon:yes stop_codon:yes gene_type:complete